MKADFKKEVASYTAPYGQFEVITVPALQYLMIDGHGDPNTSTVFNAALLTLYPVMPLEAQWWSSAMDFFTTPRDKSQ